MGRLPVGPRPKIYQSRFSVKKGKRKLVKSEGVL